MATAAVLNKTTNGMLAQVIGAVVDVAFEVIAGAKAL